MALVARELARRGTLKVSVLTGDHGQPHVELRESIEFFSWRGREIWGVPRQQPVDTRAENLWRRLRSPFSPSLQPGRIGSYLIRPDMIEVYDEINADIYTVPGNSQFSGELAYYCMLRKKKYIFLAGSDFDLYPEYKTELDKVDMYGVPYALKTYAIENAVAHLLQNEKQAVMLKDGYGIEGTVIRNPIDLTRQYPRMETPKGILWVGRSDERVKRPSLIFELARRLPDIPFTVIMNQGLPETHEACLAEAKTLPNVTLIERVPFDEVERYYAAALLFVTTSVFEGFPNTFLQAAKYGIPIVSTDVDPNGLLSRHGCGFVCGGDFEAFVENVRRLMMDVSLYAKMSAAILEYVRTHHDKDVVITQYERAFHEILPNR